MYGKYHGMNKNSVEKHKALVKKIVEIFNTGNLSKVDSIFSSEYIDYQRPSWLIVNGPEEFKQIVMSAHHCLIYKYLLAFTQ